jgi:energy-converting hydrogenase Eha subunit H
MSYHEKRAIVNMLSSILITASYSAYLYVRYLAGGGEFINDPHFWGTAFLIFIPVSIVANIIISIIFTIHYRITTREEEPSISDERDKLIELKGSRNALYAISIGIVLSMAMLVFDLPLYVMFITIIYAGLVSSVIDEFTQFYLYRRGF